MLEDVVKKHGGIEVDAMAVYSDMFKLGDNLIQNRDEKGGQFKANPIGYYRQTGQRKGHYRIFFDDTFEETLKELQEADFAIINGITYFGRRNKQENASKMYAMIFDIDGLTDWTFEGFCNLAEAGRIPKPNYIALSGHGIHAYYLFDYPIPLYPNIKIQLKAFKYAILERLWTEDTSIDLHRQYQGINQGFRPIGGKTKIDGVRVRAFEWWTHPYTLEQLGEYIPAEYRVDDSKLYKESKLTIAEAKIKYPAWYQARVLDKQDRQYWTIKRDLYDWWVRQIKTGATFHHRYFCIMALAIYGAKCGLDEKEVLRDAIDLIPFMNEIHPEDKFTRADVKSAMECFDLKYCTFPRDDISKISGIEIKPNKRNGRKQADHLKRARAVQAVDYPDGEWRGRKPKGEVVEMWQRAHPEGIKAECRRDTGLSRTTIDKYWKNDIM